MPRLLHPLVALLLATSAASAAAAPKPSAAGMAPIGLENDLLMVFAGPKTGQEAAFDQAFARQVREYTAIPGVKRAQRFAIDPDPRASKPLPEAVTFYEIATAAQPHLNDQLASRRKDGRISPIGSADQAKNRSILFRPLGPAVTAADIPGSSLPPAGVGELKDYYLVVVTGPSTPDQEDEYNRWYDQQHVPDVMRAPGFRIAQRFIRIGGATDVARYLVVFRIATRDIAATEKEIARRYELKLSVPSPAFGTQNMLSFTMHPLDPIARGHR